MRPNKGIEKMPFFCLNRQVLQERVYGSRTSTSDASGDYNSYYYGAVGKTEAVCLVPYSSNLTYNILGAGGDNIGQVKVANGSVSGRYYYLKDHLGSIRMTVDVSGNVVGYDDYYPYGMTMTGRSLTPSGEDSRYKFTGKERDASTGLDYFGARYYDSWRGQWLQVDPMVNKYPGWSPYNYVTDNPIRLIDSTGNQPGGGDDPTTFYTQYIQNEYNSIWNTGSHIVYNFTYNILPNALDVVSYSTITWAPEVSLLASGASAGLTITKNLTEGNGIITKENLESTATTIIGAVAKTKTIQVSATVLQIGFDAINSTSKENINENLNSIRKEDINNTYKQSFNYWVVPVDNTYSSQDIIK